MLINDIVATLEKIPPMLAGAWATWLFVGLLLSRWSQREQGRLIVHSSRQTSGVRPPMRSVKSAPLSSGDAFGELEAMLDTQEPFHRFPGDSTVLTPEARAAALAAPQSLP